jgi:phosphoribosylaminoimidazole-succinocarboxamide synthase
MATESLMQSHVPGFPCRRGKVRDIYDLGDTLAIVATDRISAYDWVMPTAIPGKGRILTAMSMFWFEWLGVPHHVLGTDLAALPEAFRTEQLTGRTMHVRKTRVVPVECVARGYLAGSGWKEYRMTGRVCGLDLPGGLRKADKLPVPLFTPATKEMEGKHDENIGFEQMAELISLETASELRERTLAIYRRAAAHAETKGIILADTKLEWGYLPSGELILIDEVLTPDSSRYWPRETYQPGSSPPSFDKQFLRDWLDSIGWDRISPPPPLPPEVVERTQAKYREALKRLTGDE